METGWDKFDRYCGIQGVLALMLLGGYIAAMFTGTALPQGYPQLMTFVFGYFFAKNGTGIISALKAKPE